MKRLLLVLLTLALCVPLFAAGGQEAATGAEARPRVSVMIWRNGSANYPDETEIGGIIEETLNIDFNPILVLGADMPQKKATMIASGDVPDIMPFELDEMYDGVRDDLILPLDELIDEYGPHLKQNITDELWAACTVDGRIYATPSFAGWAQVPAVRQDWLTALGLDETYFATATLDDYYELLVRFKNEDPDGNGVDDTIPFAAAGAELWQFDFIFAAFGHRVFELYELDDMVVHGAVFPVMKEGIEYLRKLYSEHLLDPEFAITSGNLVRSKYSSGNVGLYYHNFALLQDHHPVNKELWAKVPSALFIGVEPPIGPNGDRGCMKRPPTQLHTRSVVMKASENPDAAIRYLDFINSDEGWMLTKFGVEGEHFVLGDDGVSVTYLTDATENIELGIGAYQIQTKPPFPRVSGVTPIAQQGLDMGYELGNYGIQLARAAPSEKEFNQTLMDTINEYYLRMIVETDRDLDDMFDEFVDAYMASGGEILGTERYEIYQSQ